MTTGISDIGVEANVRTSADGFHVVLSAKTPTGQTTSTPSAAPQTSQTLGNSTSGPTTQQQGGAWAALRNIRDEFLQYSHDLLTFTVFLSGAILLLTLPNTLLPLQIIVFVAFVWYAFFVVWKGSALVAKYWPPKQNSFSMRTRVLAFLLYILLVGLSFGAIGVFAVTLRTYLAH